MTKKTPNTTNSATADKQKNFQTALVAVKNGRRPILSGLTNKQKLAVSSASSASSQPKDSSLLQKAKMSIQTIQNLSLEMKKIKSELNSVQRQPLQRLALNDKHHRLYASLWHAKGAPMNSVIPRPAYSGTSDDIKYLTQRNEMSNYALSLPAGGVAYVFFDKSSQRVCVYTGAGAVTDFNANYNFADIDTFTSDRLDVSGCPGPSIPGTYNQFAAALANDTVINVASNGCITVPVVNNGAELPQKFQTMYAEMTINVALPYTASATTYLIAPELNSEFCGHNMSRQASKTQYMAGVFDARPGLRQILSLPNHSLGATPFKNIASTYGKISLLRGASSTSSTNYKIRCAADHGWSYPGQLVTATAPISDTSTASVNHGLFPKNHFFWMVQGGLVIENTSPSDSIGIVMTGRSVTAVTAPVLFSSEGSAYLRHLYRDAEALRDGPAIDTRVGVTHTITPGPASFTPPKDNSSIPPKHEVIEKAVETGLATYGGNQLLKHPTIQNVMNKAESWAKAGFEKALEAGKSFGRSLLKEGPVLVEDGAEMLPFV